MKHLSTRSELILEKGNFKLTKLLAFKILSLSTVVCLSIYPSCASETRDVLLKKIINVVINPNNPSEIIGMTERDGEFSLFTINQWAQKAQASQLFGKDWQDVVAELRFNAALISPDKKYLAFSIAGHFKGYGGLLDLTGGAVNVLGFNGRIFWAPNSRQLVAELVGEGTGLTSVQLYDIPSGAWKSLFVPDPKIERYPVNVSTITWQANGSEIKFSLRKRKTSETNTWRINSDGTNMRRE